MFAPIILTLSPFSVEFTRFQTITRNRIGQGDSRYSLYGTPLDNGPLYEPKFIWEVSTIVSDDDRNAFEVIAARSDQLRRQLLDYSITVDDLVHPIIEYGGTNTRAIVPTYSTEAVLGGGVRYYARFYAKIITFTARRSASGARPWFIDFTLSEMDKFEA